MPTVPDAPSDEKDFAGFSPEPLRLARALRRDPSRALGFWELAQELGMSLPDVGDPTLAPQRAALIEEWRARTKLALTPLLHSHRVELKVDRHGTRFRWVGRKRGRKRALPPDYPWDRLTV
ncbi:MAG: hypothetical protein L3K17_05390 [Thermoplasmata archaeon]|nr:hypothetical protein [Thermoplasmata archaeon]